MWRSHRGDSATLGLGVGEVLHLGGVLIGEYRNLVTHRLDERTGLRQCRFGHGASVHRALLAQRVGGVNRPQGTVGQQGCWLRHTTGHPLDQGEGALLLHGLEQQAQHHDRGCVLGLDGLAANLARGTGGLDVVQLVAHQGVVAPLAHGVEGLDRDGLGRGLDETLDLILGDLHETVRGLDLLDHIGAADLLPGHLVDGGVADLVVTIGEHLALHAAARSHTGEHFHRDVEQAARDGDLLVGAG